ncbi:MAG: NUDIX hydrolase [Steroidobacteraceae bacterium]
MSLKPEITVAAIAERDGHFLFVQERAARRIVLNQPAGHLEHGETLLEAVARETREETGRAFIPDSITGIYLWCGPAGRTVLRVAFNGTVGERDEHAQLDRAIIRTVWLRREQVAAREAELRSPLVLRCIDDFRGGVRYPLAVISHLARGIPLPPDGAQ